MSEHQRRHKRFKIRREVFAAIVIPDRQIIVGRVLDVSPAGAAVQYLATRILETGPARLQIFDLNSPRMEQIDSTVVYDSEIPEESWGLPQLRRCGIKFQGIVSEVQSKLKRIVQNQ